MDLKDVITEQETQDIPHTKTYETNPTNDTRDDELGMSETGRMGNTYGIEDTTISQHEMENQMHHRAYGRKTGTFAAYTRLEPTNYDGKKDQEAVGGAMIPGTLVEDQASRFRIERKHGIHELMAGINLWVGRPTLWLQR